MKKFFGLTAVEYELMDLFWKTNRPLAFREIMEYIITVLKKDWKKQTLNTYLSNLQKVGLVQTERSNYYYNYMAAFSREEYVRRWTRKLVEEAYGNSIGNFVAAFTGDEKIVGEEAEKLKKLI